MPCEILLFCCILICIYYYSVCMVGVWAHSHGRHAEVRGQLSGILFAPSAMGSRDETWAIRSVQQSTFACCWVVL